MRAALLLFVLTAAALPAQVTILDEGTFTHSVNGVRVGREDFSIRAGRGGAPGAVFVAQANVLAGEHRRTVVLNADSLGGPVRVQLETREATAVTGSVVGERQRTLWLARILTERRETAREFRLPASAFVAEPGIVHQLWFVLRFGQGRPVVLLIPSVPRLDSVVVEAIGPDSVTVAGSALAAQHWRIRPLDGGPPLWELWTDASGRILRARHPASGLEALRDDPPVETAGR